MIRVSYKARNLTIGANAYTLFLHGADGANYFEYNPDNLYIVGGKVYVKVEGAGGEIDQVLNQPATPYTEGAILDSFGHMVFHASAWWLLIS